MVNHRSADTGPAVTGPAAALAVVVNHSFRRHRAGGDGGGGAAVVVNHSFRRHGAGGDGSSHRRWPSWSIIVPPARGRR